MCCLAELCNGMCVRGGAVLLLHSGRPRALLESEAVQALRVHVCSRSYLGRVIVAKTAVDMRQHEHVPLSSYHPPRTYTKSSQPRATGGVRVCFRHQ